jgi:hypothetical protein
MKLDFKAALYIGMELKDDELYYFSEAGEPLIVGKFT